MSAFADTLVSDWPPGRPSSPTTGGRSVPSRASRLVIELLCATAALGAYRSVLADVLTLAQQATGLNDDQVRARLVELMVALAALDRDRSPS
jgi:hypothetical protein